MANKVVKWGINGNFMSIPTSDRVLVCVNPDMNKLDIVLNAALAFQWAHASVPLNYDGQAHEVQLSTANEMFGHSQSFVDINDGVLRYSAAKINGTPMIAFQLDKNSVGGRGIDPNGDGIYAPTDMVAKWEEIANSIQNGVPALITAAVDVIGGFISGAIATQTGAALAAVLQAHPIYGVTKPSEMTKTQKDQLLTEVTTKGWNEYLKNNKNGGYGANEDTGSNSSLSTMGMVAALGLVAVLMIFISKNR